ncbi:MAG: hypothetical protein GY702_22745, partial [Desulfobulbaceae bacterium]|nr:hypothetical protein [Desulfobulbaceae bacterium]
MDILNQEFSPQDRIRIHINHEDLVHSIRIPLQELSDLNVINIIERMEEVLQSNQSLSVNNTLEIGVGVIHIPYGQGRTKLINVKNGSCQKKSIVEIYNKDNLCLPLSIIIGVIKLKLKEELITKIEYLNKIRKTYRNNLRNQARSLLQKLGISSLRPGNLLDLPKYEAEFDIQIIVFSNTKEPGIPLRTGTNNLRKMYLWHTQYMQGEQKLFHFEPIVNIAGFLSTRSFCDICYKGYNHDYHKCISTCPQCKDKICKSGTPLICCECNFELRSQTCFDNHKKICNTRWKCLLCKKVLQSSKRKKEEHICGEYTCKNCENWVMKGHQCNLLRLKPKDIVKKFIFYDFECEVKNNIHIPILVIAQTSCKHCHHVTEVTNDSKCNHCGSKCVNCLQRPKKQCQDCGKREVIFSGENTLDDFGSWLFHVQNKGSRV